MVALRKSNALKLQDTDQRKSNRNLSDVCADQLPERPPKVLELTKSELEYWKEIRKEMSWLRSADMNAVWLLCKVKTQMSEWEKAVEKDIETIMDGEKSRYVYKGLEMTQKRFLELLNELGGTFKARAVMMATLAATMGTDAFPRDIPIDISDEELD